MPLAPFRKFPLAPCSFQFLHPLLLFNDFPAPFSAFCAPCSFFIFLLAPGFVILLYAPFCNFPLLHAPFHNFVLLAPGLPLFAPCSFTYFAACSLFLCAAHSSYLFSYPLRNSCIIMISCHGNVIILHTTQCKAITPLLITIKHENTCRFYS